MPGYSRPPQPPPYSLIETARSSRPELLRATPDEETVIGPLYTEIVSSNIPPDIVPPGATSFSDGKNNTEEENSKIATQTRLKRI